MHILSAGRLPDLQTSKLFFNQKVYPWPFRLPSFLTASVATAGGLDRSSSCLKKRPGLRTPTLPPRMLVGLSNRQHRQHRQHCQHRQHRQHRQHHQHGKTTPDHGFVRLPMLPMLPKLDENLLPRSAPRSLRRRVKGWVNSVLEPQIACFPSEVLFPSIPLLHPHSVLTGQATTSTTTRFAPLMLDGALSARIPRRAPKRPHRISEIRILRMRRREQSTRLPRTAAKEPRGDLEATRPSNPRPDYQPKFSVT